MGINRWKKRIIPNFFYKNDKTVALLQSPNVGWHVVTFEKGGLHTRFLAKSVSRDKAVKIAKSYMELN